MSELDACANCGILYLHSEGCLVYNELTHLKYYVCSSDCAKIMIKQKPKQNDLEIEQ